MNESTRPVRRETPDASSPAASDAGAWASDAIAELLRALDVPYLAINPGASFRGLHDSLVNHLGNERPQLLLCLHEESAVAIAHGYAKASGRMMGAVLHSNVGLMHATMAVFNAWCDRVPLLLLGATGPWDAARRRPWIDWLHTCSDQGALIRDYTKWDNQPGSLAAARDAMLRAAQLARTVPCAPTYVNLDAALQESRVDALPPLPDVARYAPPPSPRPDADALARAAQLLDAARRPLILAGRVSRSDAGWRQRVALAEKLRSRVVTDLKVAAAFPTDHALHVDAPGNFLTPASAAALRDADVVLALDWVDVAGTLKQAWGDDTVASRVIHVSPDAHLHRGWSHDYQALPPADVYLLNDPDAVVPLLLDAVSPHAARPAAVSPAPRERATALSIHALADALRDALVDRGHDDDVCLTRLPLGWNGAYRRFRAPLDYLGHEGGGGVGAGPGIAVGAALALGGSGRLPIAIMGDGDFLMGHTALWTAAHYGIACLVFVANNRSFFNDELHQERVARERSRPPQNRWIGQRIAEPAIDLAAMARSMGALGIGPVDDLGKLRGAVDEGLSALRAGKVCVVDVRVQPGYDTPTAAPTRSSGAAA